MVRRAGSADLPLHGGRVPAWLGQRMTCLGAVIVEAIVLEYGRDELLRRLAHPFWFQSFGAVMGMDWHSSGITTSVLGALKRGLAPLPVPALRRLVQARPARATIRWRSARARPMMAKATWFRSVAMASPGRLPTSRPVRLPAMPRPSAS
jgi:hypothetical protein